MVPLAWITMTLCYRKVKRVNGERIKAFLKQLINANPHAENIRIICLLTRQILIQQSVYGK